MGVKELLDKIMNDKENVILTICGPLRNLNSMDRYCAYYTIMGNTILMPINYSCIKKEVCTFEGADEYHKQFRERSHNTKIDLSDAIIVVCGSDCYIGEDTMREICYAYETKKQILFTSIMAEEKEKFYFNHNLNFPLYILKENDKWL